MAKFKLTESADDIVGTARNDKIKGGPGTLQTQDTIAGGAGNDTLTADAEQNGTQAPTISDVENIFVDTGGLAFDIQNITGADRIVSDDASITFVNVAEEDLGVRFGARQVSSGTVTLDFIPGALDGNTVLRLESNNSNVTFKAETTDEAQAVEVIDLALTGKEEQVDLSAFSVLTELRLSGGADAKVVVDLDAVPDDQEILIDASQTTGDITLTSDVPNDQTVLGGSGDDDFKTGTGDDTIRSGDGNDVVNASGGDNLVETGRGADEILTEAGNDTIRSGRDDDTISSGSGDDMIFAGQGNDEIKAGDGADTIYGGKQEDFIEAQGGADIIYDGDNEDTVLAGSDSDTIVAGANDDTFTGQGGVDTFDFTQTPTFNDDTITDFTLTTSTETNDILTFLDASGTAVTLQSQQDFESYICSNPETTRVDDSTSTIFFELSGGTIIAKVSDTDFIDC